MAELTVLDLFCGAGGFSEGFRQQGFTIELGVDRWQPAVDTFNLNFSTKSTSKDIETFKKSIGQIELLPDTDIILGSPPCVSFSHSNASGKADKSNGILLTKLFLKIVAIKKFKSNSKLKAWYMENVVNSVKYLKPKYTFKDLGLGRWARNIGFREDDVAIVLEGNQLVVNAADYGAAQKRTRVISGEIITRDKNNRIESKFPRPPKTHRAPAESEILPLHKTISEIKSKLPRPNEPESDRVIVDPQYSDISISASELSDHFYDTGLYQCEWHLSRFLKTNHPYMGRMSFPEDENKPSRTVTATKIGASREALIYKSEYNRNGDGQYRTPTVREAACLMGFPITYQFKGSEGTKWRLVGNAVCPNVSAAFAKQLRVELGLQVNESSTVVKTVILDGIGNLNDFEEEVFNRPPKKNTNSRFRWHPFKDGNMTVTLSNYDISVDSHDVRKWITSVQYGTGKGFPTFIISDEYHLDIEHIIRKLDKGARFLNIIENGFSQKIASAQKLQWMYENRTSCKPFVEPTLLIEEVAEIIEGLNIGDEQFEQSEETIFDGKKSVPVKQIFALYAVNRISYVANRKLDSD